MSQERAVMLDEPPVLITGDQRRQRSEIGAAAGAEIHDPSSVVAGPSAHRLAELAGEVAAARADIVRLAQPEPVEAEPFAHAVSRSRAAAQPATACGQSGRRAPALRAPAASRARSGGSSIKRRSASPSAATSPGGTNSPASGGTVSGMAPAVVEITGTPCAHADASAMPYPSWNDGSTAAAAAA